MTSARRPAAGPGPSDRDSAASFAVFSFLLAAAILFHQSLTDWNLHATNLALVGVAFWTLLRPSSLPRFLALVVTQMAVCLVAMPFVVNHWLLLALMGLSMCTAAGLTVRPGRGNAANSAAFYRAAAPPLRVQVLLLYGFATLAKLNADFLDPSTSCAVGLTHQLFAALSLGAPPAWLATPAIWATLAVELSVPLLLLSPRTRVVAIALGGVFHALLALEGFVPFSGMVAAFYWLFAPDDMPRRVRRLLERRRVGRAIRRVRLGRRGELALLAGFAALWLLVGAALEGRWLPGTLAPLRYAAVVLVFSAWAIALAWLFFRALRGKRPPRYLPGSLRIAHPLLAAAPLLVVLNGFSPYLGLKTLHSFAMFSNLRTEGEYWNHALLPQRMRVFHFQDDLVQILSSSSERLARHAERGSEWVWVQLRQTLAREPDVALSYRRGGQVFHVARAGDDPAFAEPLGFLARRIFWFRSVRAPEPGTCPY